MLENFINWFKIQPSLGAEFVPGDVKQNAEYGYNAFTQVFGGEQFAGGLGNFFALEQDIPTLRTRSAALYDSNKYAKGIIDRLVTNFITNGLKLEVAPKSHILGIDLDTISEWSETVETVFDNWATTEKICSHSGNETFYQSQQLLERHALLSGDCLVIVRVEKETKLPQVQIIDGKHVSSPFKVDGKNIIDGVEIDSTGREIAYHVYLEGKHERVEAENKTGHRVAWLYHGSKKRLGKYRGTPLLYSVIQSIKELDRYSNAEQRAALINAQFPLTIEKEHPSIGGNAIGKGAVKRQDVDYTQPDGTTKSINFASVAAGTVLDLKAGETLKSHDTSRPNSGFAKYEEAIVSGIAWSHEMPPEILKLMFTSSYSASRAAQAELKLTVTAKRDDFSSTNNKRIYELFLTLATLNEYIPDLGFLGVRNGLKNFNKKSSWLGAVWLGAVKPSVNPVADSKFYQVGVEKGWCSNEKASKDLFQTDFKANQRKLEIENKLINKNSGVNDQSN